MKTKTNQIADLIAAQRDYFHSEATKPVAIRKENLEKLRNSIRKNEQEITAALYGDLHKSAFESYETEIGLVLSEIRYHIKNLDRWCRPKSVGTPLMLFPSKCQIRYEPFGVALIISPWNYPFQLLISPLIGAISAGNCAVLKTSPYAPQTAKVVDKIIYEAFPSDYITVVHGDREVNTLLLEQKFDYIFFTGSPALGRVVMHAAANHLTPITLELGGKSPCIVDRSANLRVAARRIVWGKWLNAGQTCVAPDYLWVERSVEKELTMHLKAEIVLQYGRYPEQNPDYPRIINRVAFDRITRLIDPDNVIHGGTYDREIGYIAPTLIEMGAYADDAPVMTEEIFGPVLPILIFDNLTEVIECLKTKDKPLAIYYFAQDKTAIKRMLCESSSGGMCINDVMMHVANHHLPFGGVGNSGMGKYHGRFSFEAFSNAKAVVKSDTKVDIPVRYAPYKEKINLLKRFLR